MGLHKVAFVVSLGRHLSLHLKYVERKRDGSFQYRRRIPAAVQVNYGGKLFLVRSLGKDETCLATLALGLSERLDSAWEIASSHQRSVSSCGISLESSDKNKISSRRNVVNLERIPQQLIRSSQKTTFTSEFRMLDALGLYLSLHRNGSSPKFIIDNSRAVNKLVERLGNLPLSSYSRGDAEDYRDNLLRVQSTGTVRRRLRMVCAIFNRAIKEKQLQVPNPFEGLGIVGEGEDETRRIPFTSQELTTISSACRSLNDDIRHIVEIQLDTGCRVAEVVGLRLEDVVLDAHYPHVKIRPFGKVRTVKTAASERNIPLVGEALWAAERAVSARRKAADGCPWLFPRYASDEEVKATQASNMLNKWLRCLKGVSRDKTTHCFRHAMRDRLRAAQVPHDIQEAIGGWGTRTIGQGYGNGYPLQVLAEHMRKIAMS